LGLARHIGFAKLKHLANQENQYPVLPIQWNALYSLFARCPNTAGFFNNVITPFSGMALKSAVITTLSLYVILILKLFTSGFIVLM
jgi:hypothetical protein